MPSTGTGKCHELGWFGWTKNTGGNQRDCSGVSAHRLLQAFGCRADQVTINAENGGCGRRRLQHG